MRVNINMQVHKKMLRQHCSSAGPVDCSGAALFRGAWLMGGCSDVTHTCTHCCVAAYLFWINYMY